MNEPKKWILFIFWNRGVLKLLQNNVHHYFLFLLLAKVSLLLLLLLLYESVRIFNSIMDLWFTCIETVQTYRNWVNTCIGRYFYFWPIIWGNNIWSSFFVITLCTYVCYIYSLKKKCLLYLLLTLFDTSLGSKIM